MKNAIASQRAAAAKADADALAELQKKGMQYDAMPPAEREAMRKATAGVVDDIKKRVGAAARRPRARRSEEGRRRLAGDREPLPRRAGAAERRLG